MNEMTFDALTRRASLAGAGLGIAAVALPFATSAKNKNKSKKKAKKKARQKCLNQVDPCSALVGPLNCGSDPDPECLARIAACCQSLGECDFTTFIACLSQPV